LPHAALLARWSRLFSPQRVLIDTIHSPAISGGTLRRFAYRLSSGLPDVVTAVSTSAAKPWVGANLVGPRLAIVSNGIDFEHWKLDAGIREEARRLSGLTGKFVWLAVGRLDPVKDHATLLRAFALLPSRAHLLIAGIGPLESMLRQLSSEL